MDPAKPESVGPPKAKWITIRGDPLPWRDWRFWAHLAAVITIAFACILLMWLYLL